MTGFRRGIATTVAGVAMMVTWAGSAGAAGTDVMTFGGDSFGQLGNGSLGASATPQKVLSGASDVAGGREHALALVSGAVYAWGSDQKGQVGDGAPLANRSAPVKLTTLSGVKAVTTGHYHSMALKTDGTVWAWGWNSKGQIGPDGSGNTVPSPVKVPLPGAATQVAAGRAHSLAIVGGHVYAWGDNTYGQLGRAPSTTSNPTPRQVSNLSQITFIAGGRDTSFAISGTGVLYAWGNNSYGQAGTGAINPGGTPTKVGSGFAQVESGADHTIALKSGAVYTWGRNEYGQLGYSGSSNQRTPKQVTVPPVSKVFAGRDHCIAIASNGSVYTWGRNDGGQLGVSSPTERSTPAVVSTLSGAVDAGGGQVFSIVLR